MSTSVTVTQLTRINPLKQFDFINSNNSRQSELTRQASQCGILKTVKYIVNVGTESLMRVGGSFTHV